MDRQMALITGIDIPIPECQLILHQPTIKEISYLTRDEFFAGVQTLTLHKSMFISEGETDLSDVSNFQLFMMIIEDERTRDKKKCVQQVLNLIFPKYKINFTPRSLIFLEGTNMISVDESNFDYIQDAVREIFCAKTGPMDQQSFNPANQKAKEIADKIMRGRQKVAEQKGSNTSDVFTIYISVLSIGLNIPITFFKDYTMFMLYDQIERYGLYTSWDLDIKSRLAGGKPEGNPPDWMKDIHSNG